MRASISVAVTALAFAVSIGGAAAQYYPQPAYSPYGNAPPPPPPPYPSQSYSSAPLPPPDGLVPPGQPNGPYGHAPIGYNSGYGPPPPPPPGPYDDEADANRAAARPYFAPDNRFPPQPLPPGGGMRPPADVGGGGAPPADATGSIPMGPVGPAPRAQPGGSAVVAALPPEDQPEQGPRKELPPQFRRQLVDFATREPAGTIVIDTPNTYLYLVLGNGKAMRYGIGVGRDGFTWTGTERVSRMKEWPDWFPPKEMIERQPYLPRFMAGGESNPLGARAMYLGNTLYRIHGTNQPSTIGSFVSSGCIRLTNEDVADLYSRVSVGTRVVVLPGSAPNTASTQGGPISH